MSRDARLLRQPGGFEGLGSLMEHPTASDLPVLDCVHDRAPRDHFDPLAPLHVGGVRDHDLGARPREAVRLKLGLLKRRPELLPEGLELAMTAIDTLERPSGPRPVNFRIGAPQGEQRHQVASVPRFEMAPHDLDVLLRHRPRSISREPTSRQSHGSQVILRMTPVITMAMIGSAIGAPRATSAAVNITPRLTKPSVRAW